MVVLDMHLESRRHCIVGSALVAGPDSAPMEILQMAGERCFQVKTCTAFVTLMTFEFSSSMLLVSVASECLSRCKCFSAFVAAPGSALMFVPLMLTETFQCRIVGLTLLAIEAEMHFSLFLERFNETIRRR